MTLEELKDSMLVEGPGEGYPNWDAEWRAKLVENLRVLVVQLWEVGVTEIFVNGSFVEDKEHPGDIDGYFECSFMARGHGTSAEGAEQTRSLQGVDVGPGEPQAVQGPT